MAQPSSSHRERERSHHHHRTISSTTLLLVLSLILAVLAVMLSLPSQQAVANADGSTSSVWGYLSPKRSQALVAREHAVAMREAEVARREADVLAGAPGGVTPLSCPPIPSPSTSVTSPQVYVEPPIQTIIKEVVKEVEALGPPNWWKDAGVRVEDLLDRESKISEREKEVGRREELIGRRETDASRRETWIMEQLISLGNEPGHTVEEEIVYDTGSPRRKPKELPPFISVTETRIKTVTYTQPPITEIEIRTETETVTVPPAAHTRVAARPSPEEHIHTGPSLSNVRPTTAIEVVKEETSLPTPEVVAEDVEEIVQEEGFDDDVRGRAERTVTIVQRPRQTRRPTRWFGGRW